MLYLSLAFSVPLKSSLSNSKAPSKSKLGPTTYGHHSQSRVATSSISFRRTCYIAAHTLRYCSCCSSCSLDADFFVWDNISFSACCNSIRKSSATTLNCAFNNFACIDTPGGITRSTVGSFILSKSNTILCDKPHAIVGSIGLTATRRFILFWSGIAGVVRGDICGRQAPTLTTTRECATQRSVNMSYSEVAIPMHHQILCPLL